MGSRLKLVSAAGMGAFAMFALTGCINFGSGFAILDREAEADDVFPADLPDYADDNLDPTSTRFVAVHDGNALYLAESTEGGVCLLVYPESSPDWVIGCGGTPDLGVGGPSGDYLVRADGAPTPEDTTQISTNVFVRD